ncbi:disease resistance protein Pik-2-like [Lolium perenne]|uniref:disease resistance protein Pik-2-like n=1 Tax=Lolium perenne TaxID=4522 RepID=UPI003A9902C8
MDITSDEVDLSRLIIAKCGGLPKVITAIAKYIHHELQNHIIAGIVPHEITNMYLQYIYDELMSLLETNPMFHGLRGLFSWIQSYFHDCPDSLKPCIFYLSIFPSSHNIRRRRLLRRWIAEGYSTEENVEKLFADLFKLSIIQQQSPSKMGVCQFNGFFREYIISRPMQDNLVFELDGHCSLDSQRAGKHLTISINWDRAKILFESLELSRLRSLTVFGEWRSFFISADAKMTMLRVLDLEDTSGVTDDDLKHIGKLIPQLKFLSLRGCKDITCLPSSLGCLRQLQTLDIKCTSIVTLPPAIMKLEKLQYVRAGTRGCGSATREDNNGTAVGIATAPPTDGDGASTSQPLAVASAAAATDEARTSSPTAISWLSRFRRKEIVSGAHDGVQFPAAATGGIGRLRALHTLGVLSVQGASGKVVRELKKLEQLRKLKLSGINRTNWQDFCFAISGHCYLESLSVRLSDYEQKDDPYSLDDISKPPKILKTLKLYGGSVHVSPVWMKQLDGLTKLDDQDLQLTISTQGDIDSLVKVQCQNMFRHLCVKPIQDGELLYGWWERWWEGRHFTAAKVLKIDCGSYKVEIEFGQFIPEHVEVLVVHCSTTDASLKLSGINWLSSLKEVWLKGTYSEAVKQHLQEEVAKHRKKPTFKVDDQQSSATVPSAC